MKRSSQSIHWRFTVASLFSALYPLSLPPTAIGLLQPATRLKLSRTHRLLGMCVTLPVVGWILSSFLLHGVGLALPNGLQGVYELEPYHAADVRLESEDLLSPGVVLAALASEGVERIYWLRLETLGGQPVYIVKPGPFDLERVYEARSGRRLDPLSDELLAAVAAEQLTGTDAGELEESDEFNRYYTVERVAAVAVTMDGDQPSEVVFARASGRVLRRTDPLASWFHTAYLSVHVWQWGDSVALFSAILYGMAALALTLVGLGYTLWWTRRDARKRWTDAVRPSRRFHARMAPVAGILLATQMLVGAYLWFNLGLIEPRFRGQGSFDEAWVGGLAVTEELADVREIASALPPPIVDADRPIQRYEWRAIGADRYWVAYPARNANGILLDARTGTVLERLTPEAAARAGAEVVLGEAVDAGEESIEYWMDFNARIPTYRFRFSDPDETDVHISQITGEVVQRRPGIWRGFGPFLAYHTFGFTGNPWFDTALLSTLQLLVLSMVGSGWVMALRGKRLAGIDASANASSGQHS